MERLNRHRLFRNALLHSGTRGEYEYADYLNEQIRTGYTQAEQLLYAEDLERFKKVEGPVA